MAQHNLAPSKLALYKLAPKNLALNKLAPLEKGTNLTKICQIVQKSNKTWLWIKFYLKFSKFLGVFWISRIKYLTRNFLFLTRNPEMCISSTGGPRIVRSYRTRKTSHYGKSHCSRTIYVVNDQKRQNEIVKSTFQKNFV